MRRLENKTKYILAVAFFAAFAFSNISFAYAMDFSALDVIKLLNQEREINNLNSLAENSKLSQAAQMKAEDMIKKDYFAHNSPQGRSPWYWFEKSGYDYKFAGENLAVNYSNVEEQHKAWMASATHRANILNANYREVGVAVVEGKIDGAKSVLTVQLFGTPMVVASAPQKNIPAVSEPELMPEVKSAEVTATPSALEVPAEKIQEAELIKISEPVGNSASDGDRIFGIIWLTALVVVFLAILSNSLISIGRGCDLIYESFRKKSDRHKILVKYDGLVKSIRINMQHARSLHPARGRPG